MSFKRVYAMACPVLHCSLPSMARQEFQHDSDMNVIVDRFLRTGFLDQPNAGRPVVDGLEMPGDFTEASNLAYEQLKDAAEKDAAEKDAAEKDAAEKDAAEKDAAEKDAAEKDAADSL